MSSIQRLKDNIQIFETMIEKSERQLSENQDDFSIKLSINNLRSQVSQLYSELYKENLKREKEIIQVRLKGEIAKYGSIPLEVLANLASSFSESIMQTSKYMKFGNRYIKNINKVIKSIIDLRIADIENGSTILYLTGNTSPDLFGNSTIQDSLENIFNLLESPNDEQLSENITTVGAKAVRGFTKLFSHLSREKLELNLKWDSPFDKSFSWEGDQEKIHSLYNTFNQLDIEKPEDIRFEGELITISLKRKFEIKVENRFTYYGMYPLDLLDEMKKLHIGAIVKGIITKTTFYNPLTDKEKHEYTLKDIKLV